MNRAYSLIYEIFNHHGRTINRKRKSLDDTCINDLWIVSTIRAICKRTEPDLVPSPFRFSDDDAAAAHSAYILQQHNHDFSLAILFMPSTALSPGSEFRSLESMREFW